MGGAQVELPPGHSLPVSSQLLRASEGRGFENQGG